MNNPSCIIPWIKEGAKVTVILPSTDNQPKQGLLTKPSKEWMFLPGHKKKNPQIPLPNLDINAESLINNRTFFKGWISKTRAMAA